METFEEFHERNPHIYDKLVALARAMKAKKNLRQWSVYAAYELVRYQWNPQTRSFSDYRLPNEFRPDYSRLIQQQEPDLKGFFRLRKRSDDNPFEGHPTLLDLFEQQ